MSLQEYVNDILTNIANGLNRRPITRIDDSESIEIGLIPDSQKLAYLEGLMLRKIKANESIDDIVAAIKVLNQIEELEIQESKTISNQLKSLIFSCLLSGFLAVGLSYFASFTCGASRSQFCQKVNIIPDYLEDLLREPPSNPNPVQPTDLP